MPENVYGFVFFFLLEDFLVAHASQATQMTDDTNTALRKETEKQRQVSDCKLPEGSTSEGMKTQD